MASRRSCAVLSLYSLMTRTPRSDSTRYASRYAALAATSLSTALTAQVPSAVPYLRSLDLLVTDSTYDGVWRCIDWNQDGDYNDPGELVSFYSDVIGQQALGNPNCIGAAPDGTVYVGDSTNDLILALRDANGDGDEARGGGRGRD